MSKLKRSMWLCVSRRSILLSKCNAFACVGGNEIILRLSVVGRDHSVLQCVVGREFIKLCGVERVVGANVVKV